MHHKMRLFAGELPPRPARSKRYYVTVRQHPQQRQLWLDIKSWFIQHQLVMGAAAVVLLLLTLNYIWVMLLVRRRGRLLERNNVLLRKQEQALETARQMSVLGEMTSGFAHELNQPLSAIRHYAQGCLIRLRGQDQQHPLLPAIEQIDAQAQRGPIRCAICVCGPASPWQSSNDG